MVEKEKRLLQLYISRPQLLYSRTVTEDHFSFPPHKAIFSALIGQIHKPDFNGSVDFKQLEQSVSEASPHLSGEALVDFLETPSGSDKEEGSVTKRVRALESEVERSALVKEVKDVVGESIDRFEDGRINPVNEVERLQQKLSDLTQGINRQKPKNAPDVFEGMIEKFQEYGEEGFDIGYKKITEAVGEFLPGRVWIVAGFPGHGKSLFTLNAMLNVVYHDRRVLWISSEMTNEETAGRIMATYLKKGFEDIRKDIVRADEYTLDFVREKKSEFEDKFYFEDRFFEIEEIFRQAIALARENLIDVVVIDHLQNVRGKGRDKYEGQEYIASKLTELAQAGNVGVWAVSQLNKEAQSSLSLYSLKGSSAFADISSTILHINKEEDSKRIFWIKSLKSRFGIDMNEKYFLQEGGVFVHA